MEITFCLTISFEFGVTARVYVYRVLGVKFIEGVIFLQSFFYSLMI